MITEDNTLNLVFQLQLCRGKTAHEWFNVLSRASFLPTLLFSSCLHFTQTFLRSILAFVSLEEMRKQDGLVAAWAEAMAVEPRVNVGTHLSYRFVVGKHQKEGFTSLLKSQLRLTEGGPFSVEKSELTLPK